MAAGGAADEVLAKASGTDFDTEWVTLADVARSGDAADVAVTPAGENTDTDAQAAIDTLFTRTTATREIDDLRVAYRMLLEDFQGPNTPESGIGDPANYWTATTVGTGGIRRFNPNLVRLDAAAVSDVASISSLGHEFNGSPIFSQRWYLSRTSNTSNGHSFVIGNIGTLSNGAYFTATIDAANAGNFIANVNDGLGGVATPVDTGVNFPQSTNFELEIRCDGAGTHTFYIDGVLVATIGTNAPSVFVAHQPTARITKAAGSAQSSLYVDYVTMRMEVAR